VANIGFPELVVILMIIVLVFGASRLPDIGESLGRTVKTFKRGMASNEDIRVTKSIPQVPPSSDAKAMRDSATDAEIVDKKS
jgi:sec-independent protein translocase protein TatA